MKCSNLYLLLLISSIFTSCSWYQRNFGTSPEPEFVPKSQYDDLERRYKDLEKKSKTNNQTELTTGTEDPSSQLVKELSGVGGPEGKDPSIVEAKNTLMETVDVFDEKSSGAKTSVVTPAVAGVPLKDKASAALDEQIAIPNTGNKLEDEIMLLKKSMQMASVGKFDVATRALQGLAKNSHPQVQVRAKLALGRIYFMQKEFDLSLQIYEEIINNHGHSGFVINALEGAVNCSEKLNQTNKKNQYESLLKDVFGS